MKDGQRPYDVCDESRVSDRVRGRALLFDEVNRDPGCEDASKEPTYEADAKLNKIPLTLRPCFLFRLFLAVEICKASGSERNAEGHIIGPDEIDQFLLFKDAQCGFQDVGLDAGEEFAQL